MSYYKSKRKANQFACHHSNCLTKQLENRSYSQIITQK